VAEPGTASIPQIQRLASVRAATFTARRIEAIVGRFYAVALVFASIEIYTNAFAQSKYLHPFGFWLILGLNTVATLGIIVGNWFLEFDSRWYILHALVVTFSVAYWPWVVMHSDGLPDQMTPFIWWSMGWGGISAGLGFNRFIAPAYIVFLPMLFAYVQVSPAGGDAQPAVAVQDGIYTFLISAVMTGMVWFLRWRAQQQDLASELAAETAAKSAALNAVNAERIRVGAVVHNQILGALNAAINAYSPEQQALAAQLSDGAITRLRNYSTQVVEAGQSASADSFFEALTNLIGEQSPAVAISSSVEGELQIPFEVAGALTEATLQAVNNSLVHAGTKVSSRRVSMKAHDGELKISVVDDGRGFWPNRVSKNRLGIRMIIHRRVEDLGGQARVISRPGEGTTVILEWRQND
jgi:signal transduction histidine kinase